MIRHLLLRLEAPLMSFGAEAVDAYGVVRDFPARSAITGLIGNALGWDRSEGGRLDALQRRVVMGSVRLREGWRIQDFQTAQLGKDDRGWTTRGRPEGRAGGPDTYRSPYIRLRDADADATVVVALRLDPAEEAPNLDAVAAALERPERPLFVGRKPFLPSGPIFAGFVDAATIRAALADRCELGGGGRAQWPVGRGGQRWRCRDRADRRAKLAHWRPYRVAPGCRRPGRDRGMTDLHLVRVAVNLGALTTFAITERVDDDDRGYATHLALRRRFGAAAPQPFRLVLDGRPHVPRLRVQCPGPDGRSLSTDDGRPSGQRVPHPPTSQTHADVLAIRRPVRLRRARPPRPALRDHAPGTPEQPRASVRLGSATPSW